jgi:hypothetical protein
MVLLWTELRKLEEEVCSFTASKKYGILKKRRLIIITLQQPFYHHSEGTACHGGPL